MKINLSKENINVGTATDPDDLVFSSDYSTLKYSLSGSKDVSYKYDPPSVTYYCGTVSHNLGHPPFFFAFVDRNSLGYYELCPYKRNTMATRRQYDAHTGTADLVFVCKMWESGGAGTKSGTANFRYFIFENNVGL